uniref:Minor histocompatibility antigen H13 n=1 Tax=Syphacia muris TaxID=451379 RepID=A0A0N5AVH9_9BILA
LLFFYYDDWSIVFNNIFRFDADSKGKVIGYLKEYAPAQLVNNIEHLLSFTNMRSNTSTTSGESTSLLRRAFDFVPAVNKANAMYLLLVILCFEGSAALSVILKPFFSYVLRRLPIGDRIPKLNLPYFFCLKIGKHEMNEGDIETADKKNSTSLMKAEFDTHDCVSLFFCLTVGMLHLMRRHWITNNILGVAFSIYGIENLHLSSFKAGTALLAGLFVYDVFWVFATDVMTTVARGIDAPILLQFPQDIFRAGWKADKYAMLGLGDIVIPGIFIALLLRFDNQIMALHGKKASKRCYFKATTFAYAFGLLLTMLMMHLFKAAQPALLYLVPVCLLVPLALAAMRGEAAELWNYCEEKIVQIDDKDADDDSPKHDFLNELSSLLSVNKNKKRD